MSWQFIIIVVVAALIILILAAVLWYLNVSGIYQVIKDNRRHKTVHVK